MSNNGAEDHLEAAVVYRLGRMKGFHPVPSGPTYGTKREALDAAPRCNEQRKAKNQRVCTVIFTLRESDALKISPRPTASRTVAAL